MLISKEEFIINIKYNVKNEIDKDITKEKLKDIINKKIFNIIMLTEKDEQ